MNECVFDFCCRTQSSENNKTAQNILPQLRNSSINMVKRIET